MGPLLDILYVLWPLQPGAVLHHCSILRLSQKESSWINSESYIDLHGKGSTHSLHLKLQMNDNTMEMYVGKFPGAKKRYP